MGAKTSPARRPVSPFLSLSFCRLVACFLGEYNIAIMVPKSVQSPNPVPTDSTALDQNTLFSDREKDFEVSSAMSIVLAMMMCRSTMPMNLRTYCLQYDLKSRFCCADAYQQSCASAHIRKRLLFLLQNTDSEA
ncbi:hypothetical protein BP00DRAFT_195037 [Aspergillus indologenus CBS 114.80]|uniref:Uncharacterized protein n=1 Tax=Aspergillus indologenus CBS 114.80 TaxID=1450541 RepID=A0A2V5IGJ6_9EURO|nr:hypothetical protein BP00DRAFT_195037 [Aspergillus indologenus CBS 114.80]